MPVAHLRLLGGIELFTRENGSDRRVALAPKPLALLAYLAIANAAAKPVRRDVLLAHFWPELPADRARAALRQALFQLRRALGQGAIRADREDVALVREAVSCDLADFEERLARGDCASAAELYRGDLIEGFYLDGMTAELEHWVEEERARVRHNAFDAVSALVDQATRSRDGAAAARWARAASALAPDNEVAARRLIATLDEFGDRAGALRAADDFARRLSEQFDASPSAETLAVVTAVRARCAPVEAADIDERVEAPETARLALSLDAERRALAPVLAPSAPTRRRAAFRSPVVAAALVVMTLSTGELAAIHRGGGATPSDTGAAGRAIPTATIASPVARRLYAEGLDRYYASDAREAGRLLRAALGADSGCAMCAYYASLAYNGVDDSLSPQMIRLAVRLADHVSEAERLLIHYQWAESTNSPARLAIAESLEVRYPAWPQAQLAMARASTMQGKWIAAAAYLRRAIASRPVPDSATGARCPLCSARIELISDYEAADSLPAALRAARAAVRAMPKSRVAWLQLSHVLSESGRDDEARAAMDTSSRYAADDGEDVLEHAQIEIRAGNYATADRLLRTLAETGTPANRFDALWYLTISLRDQGRLAEALSLARGPFRRADQQSTAGIGVSTLAEAQVLLELGQARRASEIFIRNAPSRDAFSRAARGRDARQHAWMLTQAGSAAAAAGDTVVLAALADSVRTWGDRSGFGRDPLLHHYLRGLLWMARARPDSAVAEFERATFSETEGFSRLQLERARALLALGRPRDAIPVLRHPLGGTLEAGNFYTTRTELQELLARAYEKAGEPDSAAVYYRRVAEAWRGADRQFQSRAAHARARSELDRHQLVAAR